MPFGNNDTSVKENTKRELNKKTKKEELANLAERLDKASTAYGMEISAEKTKLMTNNTSGINSEIKVNGQKFETVSQASNT